ncbi:MAG: hypothetical protein ACYTEQ_03095 [Planctomycetota bacterium]|jgi:hypothetical protein
MKLDYLKEKREFLSVVFLGVSACLVAAIVLKVAGFFVASARAERLVAKAAAESESDPNETKKYFAKYKEMAEELKERNLFARSLPRGHPVSGVSGIIGDSAIIKGKLYKVGEKIGEAKIVAIEPTYVKVEWRGKEKKFSPFDAKSAPEPGRQRKKRVAEKPKPKENPGPVRESVDEEIEAAPAEEDPLAWMGVELSPALRVKFLEEWNSMPDEAKKEAKEQWSKMSDEEKRETVDSMEKNIDKM